MENFMNLRWWSACIGALASEFLGSFDHLLYALVVFVAVDYITGVFCAVLGKTFSNEIGFRGITRKVCIFMLVGVANVLDIHVIGSGCILRSAVIFFYLSNEGISILSHAAHLGLPVPKKLREAMDAIREKQIK